LLAVFAGARAPDRAHFGFSNAFAYAWLTR
jgi:hypothetical protein